MGDKRGENSICKKMSQCAGEKKIISWILSSLISSLQLQKENDTSYVRYLLYKLLDLIKHIYDVQYLHVGKAVYGIDWIYR